MGSTLDRDKAGPSHLVAVDVSDHEAVACAAAEMLAVFSKNGCSEVLGRDHRRKGADYRMYGKRLAEFVGTKRNIVSFAIG